MTYGSGHDLDADLRALDTAFGAWGERDVDGAGYVEALRSGGRLDDARLLTRDVSHFPMFGELSPPY